jgi:hypothetical protein
MKEKIIGDTFESPFYKTAAESKTKRHSAPTSSSQPLCKI